MNYSSDKDILRRELNIGRHAELPDIKYLVMKKVRH
jgi:hypothetical protein